MTELSVCRVVWSGQPVTGGGISTFYTLGSGTALNSALNTFFGSIKSLLPAGCQVRPDTGGVKVDSNTGGLTGAWSGGTGSSLISSTAGVWAAGVGARIVWDTAGITNGRRVQGSTYIVPLVGAYYAADGTIDDTLVGGTAQNAINTFLTTMGTNLVVWTRPRATTSGVEHSVTGGRMLDKVSWLRSRRT